MDKMKNIIKWIVILLVVIAAGIAGFLFGKNKAASRFEAEKKQYQDINISELDIFKNVEGPIYVTGHSNPDTDTIGSSIAYAALLKKLGFDAKAVIIDDLNDEIEYVMSTGGIEVPEKLDDVAGKNIVLVDHSEYSQSVEGLEDANIIAIIDHHGVGSIVTGNPLVYDARPVCATATLIWNRYHNYGVEIDKDTAYVMACAILSDTGNFYSDSTTSLDKEAMNELSRIAGIEDTDSLYTEMYKASISYKGLNDEEIFFSDYKEYECGDKKYGIGCVNVYDEDGAKDMVERMAKVLPDADKSTGMDLLMAQISIFHDGISITYLVPADEDTADIIKRAFGDTATYDGTSYRLEPGISRKKNLVPAITDILESDQ